MNSITLHRKSLFLQQINFKGKRKKDGGERGDVEELPGLKMCGLMGSPPAAILRTQCLPQQAAFEQNWLALTS